MQLGSLAVRLRPLALLVTAMEPAALEEPTEPAVDIRIFRHEELLYEGRRMAFMRSYFTQTWEINNDVSGFPGVADLSSLAIKRALAFARHDCARPQFEFAEIHATLLFLGYVGFAQEDLDEMATASSEC